MQLLAIILYNTAGEQRIVTFTPGTLNVVTGDPGTGKSALLDIVDFCLGRSTVTMAVGPITRTVAWYAVVLQLPGGRAFVARPAPRSGAASSSRAMIEIGAEIESLPFDRLEVNTDADTVREQLGRAIGIGENAGDRGPMSFREPLEANLGHAVLLCLQRQSEIANRDLLFHRQGEEDGEIGRAIRDTLPYFLGAVPRDQAVQRQRLTIARRDLRRAENELARARAADEEIETSLRAMVREAVVAGVLADVPHEGRADMLAALQSVLAGPPAQIGDDVVAERQQRLERQRSELRLALRAAGEQVALLEGMDTDEQGYEGVVGQQLSRLRSLDLLGDVDSGEVCPVCGHSTDGEDASVSDLRDAAEHLHGQLASVEAIRPRRRQALQELSAQVDGLRQELRAADEALAGLDATEAGHDGGGSRAEQQAFTRGRIQHFLASAQSAEATELRRLEERAAMRREAVETLEAGLNTDDEREQVTSRLAIVGADMTRWADQLQLEHSGRVRLDLSRLTVVADTDEGPAPLFRIGSAANWIGYHLVTHLALHRYFARQDRPVPRLLMLDQPSQAYYPSDVEQQEGLPEGEEDRAAVERLFELMRSVTDELSPHFQIIVCDHANLPAPWFQQAVAHNWRHGEKLIPESWL
ncbi:MAG: DUF3732 domain-containing protein [Solirubrobacteraceae bacterium]